ncbi:MAG: YceI family protein, partial [Salinibacter sp.]
MTRLLKAAFTALLGIGVLVAWTGGPPTSYTFRSTPNEMYVEGGSTLHDWRCPIQSLSGSLELDTAGTSATPIGTVSRVKVRVPVDAIQCDKETMNDKLRNALKMNAYPKVHFTLKEAQVSPLPDSGKAWALVNATGELILAGERRQIDLPVKAQRLDNGNLRFVGKHT